MKKLERAVPARKYGFHIIAVIVTMNEKKFFISF